MKRHAPAAAGTAAKRAARLRDARHIATQRTPDSNEDAIDIDKFVHARQFEIAALQAAIRQSKSSTAQRAFQAVPRYLRRRASSHNVKLLPKRLRKRALREMDVPKKAARASVPKVVGKKTAHKIAAARLRKLGHMQDAIVDAGTSAPALARVRLVKGKFARRQTRKVWLPTHLWMVKRARMEVQYGYATPLRPSEKSYRATHRASMHETVVFDHSNYCTLTLAGSPAELKRILGRICEPGVAAEGERYTDGKRALECMLVLRDRSIVCPGLIFWDVGDCDGIQTPDHQAQRKGTRRVFVRVHPAAYVTVWKETLAAIIDTQVTLTDLRYELGSIDVRGSTASTKLQRVLHTGAGSAVLPDARSIAAGTIITAELLDPRLFFSRSALREEREHLKSRVARVYDALGNAANIRNTVRSKMLERLVQRARLRNVPHDPPQHTIPVIFVRRAWEGWTMILPWEWVSCFWICLMHTDGVRFGGVENWQQISLERGEPCFPADFIGTRAGSEAAQQQAATALEQWQRKPPAKRPALPKLLGKLGEDTAQNPFLIPFAERTVNFVTCRLKPVFAQQVPTVCALNIVLQSRGSPDAGARVYRVSPETVKRWRDAVSTSLSPQDATYPENPPIGDVIGYCVRTAYNLRVGKATAIACVSVEALQSLKHNYCLVRDVKAPFARLATWSWPTVYC